MLKFGPGLCGCGCGGKTALAERSRYTVGWTKGEPKPFLPHHKPPRKPDNFTVNPETGCHEWLGGLSDGYARHRRAGRMVSLHVTYWEQLHGEPFPKGMEPDHTCRNRRCVNGAHIEPVSKTENIRRGMVTKLNHAAVAEIRALKGVEDYRSIAIRFGITPTYVHALWRGVGWQ